MIIKDNYAVDFRRYNSTNSLLEFHGKLYTSEFNESENMVNILTINSILVNNDIITGSYVNGSTQPTIIENPQNLLCLSITSDTIHSNVKAISSGRDITNLEF